MAAGVTGSTRYFGYRRCTFESCAASVRFLRKILAALASGITLLATGCTVAAHGPVVVAIIVDAYDTDGITSIKRLVSISATGFRKDGSLGVWFNGTDWLPYPMKVAEETPFTHSVNVLPGESTFLDLSAVMLGEADTALECSVYVNGVLQVGQSHRDKVERIGNTERTFSSSAVVQCTFSYRN